MILWIKAWGAHIAAAFSGYVLFVIHGEDFIKWHIESIKKLLGFKTYIVRRIGERRKTKMTFLQMLTRGPALLQVILNILTKAGSDLPLIIKTLADFQQLAADKQDPVKLLADLNTIAPDITADLDALVALFPVPATPAAPVPPPAA